MKKEFKAPTIETKEFAVTSSVMDDTLFLATSGGQNGDKFTTVNDKEVADGFNIWKGITQ